MICEAAKPAPAGEARKSTICPVHFNGVKNPHRNR